MDIVNYKMGGPDIERSIRVQNGVEGGRSNVLSGVQSMRAG